MEEFLILRTSKINPFWYTEEDPFHYFFQNGNDLKSMDFDLTVR